jgi:hypothetical protein
MPGILKRAFADRLKGDRPSAFRAVGAAAVAGVVAATVTYKVLRG